jgi:hypothetical protein
LTTLRLSGLDLHDGDLAPLCGLKELALLDLSLNLNLTSIGPLVHCTKLRRLILSNTGVDSIEALRGHGELVYLALNQCGKLASVEPLRQCTALEEINVAHSAVDHLGLEGIDSLRRLRRISLFGCSKLTKLSRGIDGIKSLDVLGLSSTSVGNSGLCGLRSMSILSLSLCWCVNFSDARVLPLSLVELHLDGSHVESDSLACAGEFFACRTLSLSKCGELTHSEWLCNFPAVERIDVSSCAKLFPWTNSEMRLMLPPPYGGMASLQEVDIGEIRPWTRSHVKSAKEFLAAAGIRVTT